VADLPEEGEMERFFVADDNPGQVLAERELEAQLLQLIEQLPVQYKTVLTLFHLDDKNYAEIGEITGMPEGTVKSYLFRARALLKEKAKKYLNEEEWI
jgi:RNA polymerase sigma-70 factor (ECF subfamily)